MISATAAEPADRHHPALRNRIALLETQNTTSMPRSANWMRSSRCSNEAEEPTCPIYAPVRDTRFILDHVLKLASHANLPGFQNATPDVVDAVLDEGGKFVAEVLFPLNHSGDQEGCTRHEDGSVTSPRVSSKPMRSSSNRLGTLSAPEEFAARRCRTSCRPRSRNI